MGPCTARGTKLTLRDIVIKNPRDLLSDLEIKTVNRESVRKLRDKNTLQNVLMTEKRETESYCVFVCFDEKETETRDVLMCLCVRA